MNNPAPRTSSGSGSEAVGKRWARYHRNGYEVSSDGDFRYSALNVKLADGRTIEEAYQLDVKGYRSVSNDWRAGKGKPPVNPIGREELYEAYKDLWRQWAFENPGMVLQLQRLSAGRVLTDRFATSEINQARALAELINEFEES